MIFLFDFFSGSGYPSMTQMKCVKSLEKLHLQSVNYAFEIFSNDLLNVEPSIFIKIQKKQNK